MTIRLGLMTLLLALAACGGDGGTTTSPPTTATDPTGDCEAAGQSIDCRPGVDIVSAGVTGTPMVVTVELSAEPILDEDTQWTIEFVVSPLACVIDNLEPVGEDDFVGSTDTTTYGYNVTTGQLAREGICTGTLEGTTVMMAFDIQRPTPPFGIRITTETFSIVDETDPAVSDTIRLDIQE